MSDSVLMTTREAAATLGVGPSSVKRWADSGVLPCVKTPGGHRRYPRAAVLAMLESGEVLEAARFTHVGSDEFADRWIGLLLASSDGINDEMGELYRHQGNWWRVADSIGSVLRRIGEAWATGRLTVVQEHLVSERLARSIEKATETLRIPDAAPSALLVMAPEDDHTLGLSLAELVFREAGWKTLWSGRRTPIGSIEDFVEASVIDVVAVSASPFSADSLSLTGYAYHLGAICRRRGIGLVVGGLGAWPEPLPYGERIRTFEDLHLVLESYTTKRGNGVP